MADKNLSLLLTLNDSASAGLSQFTQSVAHLQSRVKEMKNSLGNAGVSISNFAGEFGVVGTAVEKSGAQLVDFGAITKEAQQALKDLDGSSGDTNGSVDRLGISFSEVTGLASQTNRVLGIMPGEFTSIAREANYTSRILNTTFGIKPAWAAGIAIASAGLTALIGHLLSNRKSSEDLETAVKNLSNKFKELSGDIADTTGKLRDSSFVEKATAAEIVSLWLEQAEAEKKKQAEADKMNALIEKRTELQQELNDYMTKYHIVNTQDSEKAVELEVLIHRINIQLEPYLAYQEKLSKATGFKDNAAALNALMESGKAFAQSLKDQAEAEQQLIDTQQKMQESVNKLAESNLAASQKAHEAWQSAWDKLKEQTTDAYKMMSESGLSSAEIIEGWAEISGKSVDELISKLESQGIGVDELKDKWEELGIPIPEIIAYYKSLEDATEKQTDAVIKQADEYKNLASRMQHVIDLHQSAIMSAMEPGSQTSGNLPSSDQISAAYLGLIANIGDKFAPDQLPTYETFTELVKAYWEAGSVGAMAINDALQAFYNRIPSFAGGGVVPGAFGSETLIRAHGGEVVSSGGAGIVINVQGSVITQGELLEFIRRGLIQIGARNGSALGSYA